MRLKVGRTGGVITITEREVKEKYEKNYEPDTSNYYTKNQVYDAFDSEKIPFISSIPKKGEHITINQK